MKKCAFLVIGAGIIGLTIARELLKKGHKDIIILEKEPKIGLHASGRNSGVLHAGIYYSPDSLKAKSCLLGNFLMKEYCHQKNIPVIESGKVVVAKNNDEIEILYELRKRAEKNGAKVEIVNEKQLESIEPWAKTFQEALFSYYTAVVDPLLILDSLQEELKASGQVKILTSIKFIGPLQDYVAFTNQGKIKYEVLINAAGTFSDQIAHEFKLGLNFRLIPFKGTYKKLVKEKRGLIKGNIYPVPDIRNPFLGVHITKVISGEVYLGPTAIPAFGRENYTLLDGLGLETADIAFRDSILLFTNEKFREVARVEPRKYIFKYFFEDAKKLVKELQPDDVVPSTKVGIRPQLVDWLTKELVMDFKILQGDNSIHILNAISPGFTSSMDFAQYIVENYISE